MAFNSFANEDPGIALIQEDPHSLEGTSLLARSTNPHLNESIVEFMNMCARFHFSLNVAPIRSTDTAHAYLHFCIHRELHLQIKLIELQGLLAQTQHEPRLKGPFPVALYRSMLTSLQTILDKLHSMRCVTSREEWHTVHRFLSSARLSSSLYTYVLSRNAHFSLDCSEGILDPRTQRKKRNGRERHFVFLDTSSGFQVESAAATLPPSC